MTTFDKTQHPRETTGKFATKTTVEADGGLGALDGEPAPLAAAVVAPINGLVARQTKAGRWALYDVETGASVFGRGMENRRRHSHGSREEAEQWAQGTYPLVRRTRDRLEHVHPRSATCVRCGGPLDQDLDGGVDSATYVVSTCPRCRTTFPEGKAA